MPKGKEPNDLEEDTFIEVNQTKVYMIMESMKKEYDPLNIFEKILSNLHDDGVDMMIFHPGYLDFYILNHSSLLIPRTLEVEMLTSSVLKEIIQNNAIELVTYKEL